MTGTKPPGPQDDDVEPEAWRYDPDAAGAGALPARFDVWGRPPGQEEAPAWNAFSRATPVWGEDVIADPPAPWTESLPPAADPWIGHAATTDDDPWAEPDGDRDQAESDGDRWPESGADPWTEQVGAGSAADPWTEPQYQDSMVASSYAPSSPMSYAAPRSPVPPLGPPPPLGSGVAAAPRFPAQVFPADPTEAEPDAPVSPSFGQRRGGPVGQRGAVPQPPPWPTKRPGRPLTSWEESLRYGEPYGATDTAPREAPPASPSKSSRKGLKIFSAVLTLVLLGVIGFVVKEVPGRLLDAAGVGDPGYPTATAPSGVSATSTAQAQPSGPFEGTPAARYPEGDAGITLPAATAVPGFTAAQVDAALKQVKLALVATRLDPAMLTQHDAGPLLKLLSPQAGKELATYFTNQKFFGFATQLADGYSLTSDKVRVTGRVTFRGSTANGVRLLEVITNFVWVYPFAGALQEAGDHLVIVHDEVTWAVPVEADVDKDYRGLRISGWDGFASNMDCELLKKSLLALGKPQLVTAGADNDSNSAFEPGRSLDVPTTC